jgi:hypothetical protein
LKKFKIFLDEKLKNKYLLYIVERYDLLSKHTQMKLESLVKKHQKNIKWVFINKKSGKSKEMVKYIKKRTLIEKFLIFENTYPENHFKLNRVQWLHIKKNNFSLRKNRIHYKFDLSRYNGTPDFKFLLEKIKIITKFDSPFDLFWVRFLITNSKINAECLNVFVPNSVKVDFNRFFNYKKILSKFSNFLKVILKKNQKKQYLILVFFLMVYF